MVKDISDTEDTDYMPPAMIRTWFLSNEEERGQGGNKFQEKLYASADSSDGDDMQPRTVLATRTLKIWNWMTKKKLR